MSCYEWEAGTLTLPSGAVAGLKSALRKHANTFHADVRAEVARLHKEVGQGTRSAKKYNDRFTKYQREHWERGGSHRSSHHQVTVSAGAFSVVESMIADATPRTYGETIPIHKPTLADISRIAPPATARTVEFPVIGNHGDYTASITFNGRTVEWSVPDSNHATEHARNSPLARLFFAELDKIAWTRGSGGTIVGNNEYNGDDDQSVGAGGNYLVQAFGPRGKQAQASHAGTSLAQWEREAAGTYIRRNVRAL